MAQRARPRLYYIEKNTNIASTNWLDSGLGLIPPSGGTSTTSFLTDTNFPERFYRVQAVLPLAHVRAKNRITGSRLKSNER